MILRQAVPDDIDAMLDVWIDAFGPEFLGGRGAAETWLRWALSENPAGDDRWGYVAEKEGLVVAAWLNLPCRVRACGRIIEANWLCSTAVSSKGQRQGIGRKIYRRIVSDNALTLGVGVEAGSRALYESENVTFVPASVLFERPAAFTARLREVARDLKGGKAAAAFGHLRGLLPPARPRSDDLRLERVSRFSAALAPVLEDHARRFPVGIERSVDWLNWLLSLPVLDVTAFEVRQGTEPVGLVLIRSDGLIMELIAISSGRDLTGPVLARVIDLFRDRTLRAIVPQTLQDTFRKAGFRRRLDFGLFFVPTGDPEIDRICADPGNWHLTFADSDTYTFRADFTFAAVQETPT